MRIYHRRLVSGWHFEPYISRSNLELKFKEPEKIINKVDKNLKVNIEFNKSEKNKLDFLVGKS